MPTSGRAQTGILPEFGLQALVLLGVTSPEGLCSAGRSKRSKSAPVIRYLDVGLRCATDASD